MTLTTIHHCSFCEKDQQQVKKLVAGNDVYICNECITLCYDILKEDAPRAIPENQIHPARSKHVWMSM